MIPKTNVAFIDKGFKQLDYSNTKVIVNGGEYTGFVDNEGKFSMYGFGSFYSSLEMYLKLEAIDLMCKTSNTISNQ